MDSHERSDEEDVESPGGGAVSAEPPLRAGGEASGSEGETSDSGSSNSSSSSTGSSSSSDAAARSPNTAGLLQADEYGDHLNVSCAGNSAKFYLNRFARGSIGRCVLFKGRWITPNEFQAISGRQSSKDWKRSIRLRGRCLKEFIAQGLFQEHVKTCVCSVCSGEATEHLRQEGEMALAAKRRRLSQADVGGTGPHVSESTALAAEEGQGSSSQSTPVVGTKRRRGRGGKLHRVWSPSGEVAQEGSGEDMEGEEGEEEGKDPLQTSSLAETPDSAHGRPRRSLHRKFSGYRTELGTYTHRPKDWDSEEVAEFLRLQGFGEYAEPFQEGEMDGESMFLLKEHHLTENFGMKLGPALKLLDTIGRLRHPPVL